MSRSLSANMRRVYLAQNRRWRHSLGRQIAGKGGRVLAGGETGVGNGATGRVPLGAGCEPSARGSRVAEAEPEGRSRLVPGRGAEPRSCSRE
jgi:hypothetical protein